MTIINANTSSMKVLNACKENGILGEEIREGGRGKEAESQGGGRKREERGRQERKESGTREGKKKSHAKFNEFLYLYLFCSGNVCCFRIPVDWKRMTERGKSKISDKVNVNDRRGCYSKV